MDLASLNKKKDRIAKWTAAGLAIVVVGVAAPLIFAAFQATVALIATLAIGGAAITFAPLVGMKFANWKLKGIKAEARQNPIETLENVYRQKSEQWDVQRKQVETFNAAVQTFEGEVRVLAQKYPARKHDFAEQLAKMRKLLTIRSERLIEAKRLLREFYDKIQEQKAVHRVALAALSAADSSNKFNDGEAYEQIKIDESLFSVQNSMNLAFSSLDSVLMEESFNPSKNIPVSEDEVLQIEQQIQVVGNVKVQDVQYARR